MAMRGERFELNLDPEDAFEQSQHQELQKAKEEGTPTRKIPPSLDLVNDVLEREPAGAKPPEPPKFKQTPTGFPVHRKRDGLSRFKQKRAKESPTTTVPAAGGQQGSIPRTTYLSKISNAPDGEKDSIDQQTTQMIQNMSPEELAEARKELVNESSVGIIERLTKRSTVKVTSSGMLDVPQQSPDEASSEELSSKPRLLPAKKVAFAGTRYAAASEESTSDYDPESAAPIKPPNGFQTLASTQLKGMSSASAGTRSTRRSPKPDSSTQQRPPTLDPNSDTFLSDLHSTYFPNLPADPTHLAWMAPLPNDAAPTTKIGRTPTATPSSSKPPISGPIDAHIPPSHLRFDMRGALIPSSISAAIPVTAGLHHHGRDPGLAGYTIGELAMLARSTVAPQRCFAYQLLGRVLYRLGVGAFGDKSRVSSSEGKGEGTDAGKNAGESRKDSEGYQELERWEQGLSEREKGLWEELRKGRVLETMLVEAAREPGAGNESARVWALEAVWLWRKGGGKGLDDGVQVEEEGEELMGEEAGRVLEEGLNPS